MNKYLEAAIFTAVLIALIVLFILALILSVSMFGIWVLGVVAAALFIFSVYTSALEFLGEI